MLNWRTCSNSADQGQSVGKYMVSHERKKVDITTVATRIQVHRTGGLVTPAFGRTSFIIIEMSMIPHGICPSAIGWYPFVLHGDPGTAN